MKRVILNQLLRKLQSPRGGLHVRRVGPIGGFLIFLLVGVLAVVGLLGFAALSVGLMVFSVVRSFLPRPRSPFSTRPVRR
jgi:hypothetical protein